MRIVFAGTPEFAVPSLHALVAAGHEVVGVITREDAPHGRKRVLTPSPVATAAEELGLPVLRANTLDDAATAWAAALAPDLGVIVAYGGLVREPLLSLPSHGWINLHFSELPRWRGAAPVQRALEAGEQTLGVTVFRLVAALDAGDVLTRDAREFAPGTSAGAALTELADFGTAAVLEAVSLLASDPAAGEPQRGEETYARKLTREDGKIDLARPAAVVLAHWAGVTPEPGAYALHDGQPLKLLELAPLADTSDLGTAEMDLAAAPGTVTLIGGAAVLTTSDGPLLLRRVQPAGKPAMEAAAWLRGRDGQAVLA
ncbi:methionyl-tRNA formyltransferase [Leucobacter luti]|uniref:methionyl-tRNA formyltransferase n=1 Tax=Leucobacter luti TaxID=340320 RepID=UPI00104940EA|nr:methionyl-tRNA formyltransferase [Leucobacter luti]MCW2287602.1 methionyl-tRNA formyltransferase [Leucobacter luti]TCK46230.1 methionyl-tRNA formyltransferase [Leucobacter luti]